MNTDGMLRKVQTVAIILGGIFLTALYMSCPAYAQDAMWRSYYSAAQKEYQSGNYSGSESLLRAALTLTDRTDESLSTYFYLATVCAKRERFKEAEQCYNYVLDGMGTKIWAVLRPPDGTPDWEQSPTETLETSDSQHFFSMLKQRPERLLTVKLAKPITIVDVLEDYGTLLQRMNRYPEAEYAFKQALMLSDSRPDQAVNYEVSLLQKLSVLYELEGRNPEHEAVNQQLMTARNNAIPDFDRIVNQTIQKIDRIGHNQHALAIRLNNLAIFCATHGDYTRAGTLFNRALSCLNQSHFGAQKDRAIISKNYSDLLLAMGRTVEANNLNKEANTAVLGDKEIAQSGQ